MQVAGTTPVTSTSSGSSTVPQDGSSVPPRSTTTAPAQKLAWQDCSVGQRTLECAKLTVPLDYSNPARGTIQLALERRPASDSSQRVGTLLVNPGGPGIPGTGLVEAASSAFSSTLRRRFDIVGWDPRGTGNSAPVDCVDNLDPYLTPDPTPDSGDEKQALIDAAKAFAAKCEANSGRILPYISTQDSARDMEEIRKALGEDKISYFGFSYGSELGATFATMFPQSVRAMVVDGAVDPNSDAVDEARRQVTSLEKALDAFLADCAADSSCAFHSGGDPGAAFDQLMARLDTRPLRYRGREIGQGIAYTAAISALYDKSAWPILAEALDRAQRGDGEMLALLYDSYTERGPDGTYSDAFEGLIAINCLDDPGPTDPAVTDELAAEFTKLAPRLGEASAYGYFCSFWPVPRKPPIKITGAGAGPIVVVGTTGDPITPLESTKRLAAELEQGVLVTVVGDRHTGYKLNGCVVKAVDDYLVDLTLPKSGLVCG